MPLKKNLLLPGFLLILSTAASYAQEASPAAAEAPAETGFWLWNFLGHLHPLAVHFPIGLMLFAVLLELLTLKNFNSVLRPAIRICLLVGVIAAIVSASFGWLLAGDGDYGGTTLDIHQYTGIATAVLGITALIFLYSLRKNITVAGVRMYRFILFSSAVGISVTGHFGASLTHGDDYLTSTLPWSKDYQEGGSPSFASFASLKNDSSKLDPKHEMELNIAVKSIFAHNCYKCHGAEKVKGDLRLDNKEMLFRGGESGPLFVAGDPTKSEIMRRLTLPRSHKDAMPPKGKKLSEDDISTIEFWIQKGAPWPEKSDDEKVFRIAKLEPRNPALPVAVQNMGNPIDLWVNEYFKKNKIKWPAVVDDRTYLRRIFLDIIGLLPSPTEQAAFAGDTRPDKRAIWVRQLLNRSDDYATHWLTFWNDALRNDYTGTGYIDGGRTDITKWLYASLKNNKPYNIFVKELISPTKESKGFIEGIKWRGVVNASQRPEIQAAQNVSQVFFGLNLKCASCHNSFINQWKLEDAYAFANIFSDTSLEINRCDKPTGKYTNARMLWQQLGSIDTNAKRAEKQAQLAELMTKPANGRIYRTIVNRIWAQFMGRGLVEPVDVMDNAPWSQDLLDWLAYHFSQEGKFDIRELMYQIATSQTYQLPSVSVNDPMKLTAENFKFAGMVRRRMSAEQFTDAVGNIIAPLFDPKLVKYKPLMQTEEESANPTVNRASLVQNNVLLTALGRPNRETVSTGRESQANLLQALELTNGSMFMKALKTGAKKWKTKYPQSDALVSELYMTALARPPLKAEMDAALKVLGNAPQQEAVEDLLWAVVLLPEFQLIY